MFKDICIDSISILTIDTEYYDKGSRRLNSINDIKPYLDLEHFYYNTSDNEISSVYMKDKLITSVEMSNSALQPILQKRESYNVFVIGQTIPNFRFLNPPLAKILNENHVNYKKAFGLSHLGPLCATEGLQAMKWSLCEKEVGLLLLVEKCLTKQQLENVKAMGDIGLAFNVKKEDGPLVVKEFGRETLLDDKDFSVFVKKMIRKYVPTRTIIQNSLFNHSNEITNNYEDRSLYRRKRYADLDFQSGDVWLTFEELLREKKVKIDDSVLVISWNYHQDFSYCLLNLNGKVNIYYPPLQG